LSHAGFVVPAHLPGQLLKQVPYWKTKKGEDGKGTKCTAYLNSEKLALKLGKRAHKSVLHFLEQQEKARKHANLLDIEAAQPDAAQQPSVPPSRKGSCELLLTHAIEDLPASGLHTAAATDAGATALASDSASKTFSKPELGRFLEAHRAGASVILVYCLLICFSCQVCPHCYFQLTESWMRCSAMG
jgi:hypothetical protein